MAVLSDIHGNIRALDAVLADIKRRNIHDIVNLGDCAYGPFDPRPVLNRLLELHLPTVSGNEDRLLVDDVRVRHGSRTATFCVQQLRSKHLAWLAELPLTLNVHGALLFHGKPNDDTQYLLTAVGEIGSRPRTPHEIADLLGDIAAALILCAHDHTPRTVRLADSRLIVNPGSIGCPAYTDDTPYPHAIENGSPDARYAVIERQGDSATVELIGVTYDSAAAGQEAYDNGFPDWALWIATGRC
jgi:predicted phosphodiesterase